MANVAFTPKVAGVNWSNLTHSPSVPLDQGVQTDLVTSDEVNNNSQKRGLRLFISFDSVSPDVVGAPFYLGVVVDGKTSQGTWSPIAYMSTSFRWKQGQTDQHTLIIDPTVDTANLGIPEAQFAGDEEVGRIHRNRGFVPDEGFRIRIVVKDNDPTGNNAFQSVTMTISGEQFDA